jgi:hypothetical protein
LCSRCAHSSAATNKNLEPMIEDGAFLPDLILPAQRFSASSCPYLRDRREGIPREQPLGVLPLPGEIEGEAIHGRQSRLAIAARNRGQECMARALLPAFGYDLIAVILCHPSR